MKKVTVDLSDRELKAIEEIKNYFSGYGPWVYEKMTTSQIIRAGIASLHTDVTKKLNCD